MHNSNVIRNSVILPVRHMINKMLLNMKLQLSDDVEQGTFEGSCVHPHPALKHRDGLQPLHSSYKASYESTCSRKPLQRRRGFWDAVLSMGLDLFTREHVTVQQETDAWTPSGRPRRGKCSVPGCYATLTALSHHFLTRLHQKMPPLRKSPPCPPYQPEGTRCLYVNISDHKPLAKQHAN